MNVLLYLLTHINNCIVSLSLIDSPYKDLIVTASALSGSVQSVTDRTE